MIKVKFYLFIVSFIVCSAACYAHEQSRNTSEFNIQKIQQLTGQKGQFELDKKIYKLIIPRDDLTILMSGMQLAVDRGLSSTVYFEKSDNKTLVSGDLILLQDQVNPVMSVALDNDLQVTGLNNPYLWDSPRVMVMRIKGEGDTVKLAKAIGAVLKKITATMDGGGDFPLGDTDVPKTSFNSHKIDVLLGAKGQFNGDVYVVPFKNAMKKTDADINKKMAANSWVSFTGSESEAVINGALLVHQSELQNALITLRKAKIYILAIYHYPMSDDSELVSINFWGIGKLQSLAKPLRSAFLLAQNGHPEKIELLGFTTVPLIVLQTTYCSYEDKGTTLAQNSQQVQEKQMNVPMPSVIMQPTINDVLLRRSLLMQSMDSVKTIFTKMLVENKYPPNNILFTHFSVSEQLKVSISSTLTESLDSVRDMISRLSMAENRMLHNVSFVYSSIKSKLTTPNIIQAGLSPHIDAPSATAILLKLSVVRNNHPDIALLTHPRIKEVAVVAGSLPVAEKLHVPVTLAGRKSFPSATAMLLKLSVVKNNRIVVVLAPHRPKVVG